MMKQFLSAVVFIGLLLLVGCGNQENQATQQTEEIIEKVNYDKRKAEALENGNAVPFEITQRAINLTESKMMQDPSVTKAVVEADSSHVQLILFVNQTASYEKGKELGARMARVLATFAQGEEPSESSYGRLYDFYSLGVRVVNHTNNQILGVKPIGARTINWDARW